MRKRRQLLSVTLLLSLSNNVVSYIPTIWPSWSMKRQLTRLGARNKSIPAFGKRLSSLLSRNTVNENEHNTVSDVADFQELQEENEFLRQAVHQLQSENKRLHEFTSRIVIESFERQPHQTENAWYESSSLSSLTKDHNVKSGYPVDDALWCDELDDDTCPIEPTISFVDAMQDRARWLVGLLILQSCSGFILSHNEALLDRHPVIIYFLTMLVGAGGNAGNQASVRVIRGLALGTLNERTQSQFLWRELRMAGVLATILSVAGFVRAIAFSTPMPETIAVTSALALIVVSSICLGAVLPLVLKKLGIDPAHSSTTIQVVMDILGVVLTVAVSTVTLDTPLGQMIVSTLTGSS